jgi:hypothetical protein
MRTTPKTGKTISALMIFCSIFAAFAGTLARPAPAEASLVAAAAAMVVLLAESGVVLGEQKLLTAARESIQEAGQNIFERAVSEMRFDTTMYMHDHRPMAASLVIGIDTSETAALFTRFRDAGAVSFPSPGAGAPPSGQIARFANGRAGIPGSGLFTAEYQARMSSLASYARGVMESGDADRDTLAAYQDTIKNMDAALRFDIEEGKLEDIWENEYEAMRDFHDKLPYKTADPNEFKDTGDEDFLKDEILTGAGYTWTLAATGQMAAFRNILFSEVRAAGSRQAEADAKFALNTQREREDSRLAFERSVGAWNASAPSVY